MIYRKPGQVLNHVISDITPGLLGQITYELYDLTGVAVTAPTAVGITEPRPGTYVFTGAAPSPAAETTYIGRFDLHDGSDDPTYEEEVTVNAAGQPAAPAGLSYATVADLRAYSPLVANFSDEELEAVLVKAQRQVDRQLTGTFEATGLRAIPADLETNEATALREATCEQALYRIHWGEQFFMMPNQPVSGGDASTNSKVPKFAPEARAILIDNGMLRLTGHMR